MKKFFASAFVVLSMFAFVACETNPGIKAAKKFIKNPTRENMEKVTAAEDKLDVEELAEFHNWCKEHENEIQAAIIKGVAAEYASEIENQ